MKKYIEIPVEALERLVEGKYVEGSLHRDAWTGKIVFNAWVCLVVTQRIWEQHR